MGHPQGAPELVWLAGSSHHIGPFGGASGRRLRADRRAPIRGAWRTSEWPHNTGRGPTSHWTSLGVSHVTAILGWRCTHDGASPRTPRREYGCLSSFFSFLQDMGHVEVKPARRLPRPRMARSVAACLSEEMAQKLIAAADRPWPKAVIVLLLTTGIRRAEAAGLTLDNLDLERRQLLTRGKGSAVFGRPDEAVRGVQAQRATRRLRTRPRATWAIQPYSVRRTIVQ